MNKRKELSFKSTAYLLAAVVALGIGLATITHADEGENRDRGRENRGPGNGFFNLFGKFDLRAPDFRVRIEDDNDVRVRGATVTATSTSGFTATSNTPPFTFNVQTDSSTKFEIKGSGRGSIADIAVGDTVNFRGVAVSDTTSTVTVKATNVENKTAHPKSPKTAGQVSIKGTVESVSTTAGTLVIVGRNGTTTVSVSGTTSIKNDEGNTLALANLATGSEVKVSGTLNASTQVFAAAKVVVEDDDDGDGIRAEGVARFIARLEALIAQLKLRFGL
ncbi:hypothetical protein A3C21_03680 [Candidatus Kaiserbacteria bacterium RIFCSPHIGHO2_02_FULL_59_21]|uniref:DUF5666 domain-containing protein n=1 Tax=Candidatus Kaiserbacteria bacterium RIFCSPHIGHO2_02_FULL_59_21 TaxID=1798500 RepID=A0A1F6DZQ3_9BACT|nr:MAG: hypothetical protein A2766_01470 [Candidatus Kaiserbacteria bacterium RIFCSPHIGHO2_01_FULL_58_22]OGG66780.1 MAG: hypothetical protein A3C21_03680 [Candidatus Kaiserbacteria bacterium RIFCSPHIGHO2_02_FULL_59_21]OGG87101.1 MAG: hypothetical protein A3I47_02445 [Candidatus Kaiserbacteria bacterium RIFCSPLOWO2_02_FULL_59_19]